MGAVGSSVGVERVMSMFSTGGGTSLDMTIAAVVSDCTLSSYSIGGMVDGGCKSAGGLSLL